MMKRMMAGLMLSLMLWAPAALALDEVVFNQRGRSQKLEGIILEDNVFGIKINAGAERKIARPDVTKWVYSKAAMSYINNAMIAYNNGQYDDVGNLMDRAKKSLGGLGQQRPLVQQHMMYYVAMADFHMGKYKEAADVLEKLLDMKKDTAYYFEAGYYSAKALEMAGKESNALRAYKKLAPDYKQKAGHPALGWAKRWSLLAAAGVVRLELQEAVAKGETGTIRSQLGTIEKMKESDAWGLLSGLDQAEIVQAEADGLAKLGDYEKLIKVLNNVIRVAQEDGNSEALQALYMKRGDAAWNLMQKKGPDINKWATMARFDYLRADLVFSLPRAQIALANYRIGECFVAIKDNDWKARAINHFQKSQSQRKGQWSDESEKRLKELK